MTRHANISVFIPHLGCPHRCSFCNQIYITGKTEMPTEQSIAKDVEKAMLSNNYDPKSTELAFFGGSFTAIDKSIYENYLKIAKKYIDDGIISGIRISTRPDAISKEILDTLKKYGVTAIELGAQSMDNAVLEKNFRGHTKSDVENASKLILEYGFDLGLQMMTGLYNDTPEKAIKTAEEFIKLKPKTVRIYPTIVLKNTYLEELFKKNEYTPETVEEASNLSAKLIEMFMKNGINVIRVGLHSIDEKSYVSGPWHPAFGEITASKIYKNKLLSALEKRKKGDVIIFINQKELSKFTGQKKKNILFFKDLGYNIKINFDNTLKSYEIRIKG